MNKTLKTLNEGFDKRYCIQEAQQQPQKTISPQKRRKIEEIIRNNLEGKIPFELSGFTGNEEDLSYNVKKELKNPYLFKDPTEYMHKDKEIKDGVINKDVSFYFDSISSGSYKISFDKNLYDKLTSKTVEDVKNFLKSQDIQFDSVRFINSINSPYQHSDKITYSTFCRFVIEQHDVVDTEKSNKLKSFDNLYITVSEWYRIKDGGRTLCFGGIDKQGFIRVNAVIDQGVQGGTQVTFPSQDEAENFIAANGYQYARISKSKATDQIIPVKTKNGYAYATKRFIKEHETHRYPLPVIDYDLNALVDVDWDVNNQDIFSDDDFSDY